MQTLKKLAVIGVTILAAASPALAGGTKYSANLVTNDPADPPSNPDLSPKSSVKLDSKGAIAVSLAGVTDGAGELVTSNGSLKATNQPDATTYVAIIKLVIPAISGGIPVVELPVVVDLKGGKGKAKLSAAPLFGFLDGGLGRSLEIIGTEVWGPLGGQAAACQAVITQTIPVSLTSPDPACRGGSQIGMSGLYVPAP